MKKHVANILTGSRIVIAALIVAIYFMCESWFWWCLGLFIFGCLTDVVDGSFARKYGTVSDFGKLFDPVADKIMMVSIIFVFVADERIAWWVLCVVAGKELTMMLVALLLKNKVGTTVSANWVGKSATVLFSIAVVLAAFKVPYNEYVVIAAVVWTLVAMVQYGAKYLLNMKKG